MKLHITSHWYRPSLTWLTRLLLPFSWLFGLVIRIRVWMYEVGIFKTYLFAVPVVVCGNITVGGTGKTPFVISLAGKLKEAGWYPGIVSKGVGGKPHKTPYAVNDQDSPHLVGDEALLLKNNTACPLVIGANRAAAVKVLLKNYPECNVVLSDDGLQHYALGRSLEIAVIDNLRLFGNQQLLPAGPLREPIRRLKKVDLQIHHGTKTHTLSDMVTAPDAIISVINKKNHFTPKNFPYRKVHAIAGIGHPERFFMLLEELGFKIIRHAFPDHHCFTSRDLDFRKDNYPIMMTEKDAVKCRCFANERFWYLTLSVMIKETVIQSIMQKLAKRG